METKNDSVKCQAVGLLVGWPVYVAANNLAIGTVGNQCETSKRHECRAQDEPWTSIR